MEKKPILTFLINPMATTTARTINEIRDRSIMMPPYEQWIQ
jgi:hypothetical protein